MESQHTRDRTENISTPASQFDQIAFLYDELMAGVPYREWVEYVEQILSEFEYRPYTVLDLCCGTGSASQLLAEKGYRVSGVDVSSSMIELARRKARDKGLRIDYHVQDASSFNLPSHFDLVVSLFDSLNYILESSALQQVFHRVSAHLKPEGLFVFDMNTELALAGGFFDQSNAGSSRASVLYDWRSSYDPAARLCRVNMSFLHRRGNERKQIQLVHYQRAYDEEEVVEMLNSAGLQVLALYDAYTFRRATKKSDRIFFVARK